MTKLGIDFEKSNERGETVLTKIDAADVGAVADTPAGRQSLAGSPELSAAIAYAAPVARARPIALGTAPRGIAREYPVAVKPLSAPIFDQAESSAGSIYWPWLINMADYGGEGAVLVYSTDHAAPHSASGIYEARGDSPLETLTDFGRTYRDDAGGQQTETASDIWDEVNSRWLRFYQQDAIGVGVQSTLLATSPDRATWTRVGIVLNMQSLDDAGDGHTGYFMPFRHAGMWHGFSLYGGTETGRFAVWHSKDGVTWQLDPRLIGAAQDQITHLPGFTTKNWAVKWINGNVIEWRGHAWWIGMAGDRASGGAIVPNRLIAGPLREDFRGFAERPVDITPAVQGWETTGIDNIGNIARFGDRLFMPYRSNGSQGQFGMMEIV